MAGSSDVAVIGTTLLDRDIYVTVIVTQRYKSNYNIMKYKYTITIDKDI